MRELSLYWLSMPIYITTPALFCFTRHSDTKLISVATSIRKKPKKDSLAKRPAEKNAERWRAQILSWRNAQRPQFSQLQIYFLQHFKALMSWAQNAVRKKLQSEQLRREGFSTQWRTAKNSIELENNSNVFWLNAISFTSNLRPPGTNFGLMYERVVKGFQRVVETLVKCSRTKFVAAIEPSSKSWLWKLYFKADSNCTCVNDPSAGSPTETLLRLLLPLSDKVHKTFRSAPQRTAVRSVRIIHRITQSVGATGGVYKGQGRNRHELLTRAY